MRFCFLLPVAFSFPVLHVVAPCDVSIAIYWWQQKCVCRRWVTNGITELYYYFVNNTDSRIVKKRFVYMNEQERIDAIKWESANRGQNPYLLSPAPVYMLHLTHLLCARIEIHVIIPTLKIRSNPFYFSQSICFVFSCVTQLILMGLCCP